MKRAFWLGLFAIVGCGAAPVAEVPALRAIPLQNAGFEMDPLPPSMSRCAPKWECHAHADPSSYEYFIDSGGAAGGERALRIQRAKNEPWGSISQGVRDPALAGARVRFSMAVRTEGATGNGAGPYLVFQDGSGRQLGVVKKLGKDAAWKRLSVEYVVPATNYIIEAGAILEGPGKAWIDEVRLEVLENASPEKKPV